MQSTWVKPRLNRPVPWVRGKSPTSQEMGRSSLTPRPLTRLPCSSTLFRSNFRTSLSKASSTSPLGYSAPMASTISACKASIAICRVGLSAWKRAACSLCSVCRCTAATISGATSCTGVGSLGLPKAARISSCNLLMTWLALWANSQAFNITASVTSLAPASTMAMVSLVLTMVRSRSLPSSCASVGFNISSLLIMPTRTAPTGPS